MGSKKKKATRPGAIVRRASGLPKGYASWLDELKGRIRSAQAKAAFSVNAELVLLYWSIGGDIVARQ